MKRISIILLASVVVLLTGIRCTKNEIKYGDFDVIAGDQALLKINYVSAYASNPTVYLAIDGERVSNPLTSRTPFPGGGLNTGGGSTADYLTFAPGKHVLSVVIPKKGTGDDSIPLLSAEINIEGAKSQTVHITDTAANTQVVTSIDDRTKPDTNSIRYKFVHLMPNVPAVDLYYGTTVMATNVAYKEVAVFTTKIPPASLAWAVRPAGALPTSTALATYTSLSTITNRRVYTIFALGYSGQTDAARKPYLSFLLNW